MKMPVSSVRGVSQRTLTNTPDEQRAEPVGKTCRSCRIDRPIAASFPCRFTADGYSERCRSCVAAAAQRDKFGECGSRCGERALARHLRVHGIKSFEQLWLAFKPRRATTQV